MAWLLTGLLVVAPVLADSRIVVHAANISQEILTEEIAGMQEVSVSANDAELVTEDVDAEETDAEELDSEEADVELEVILNDSEITLPTVDVPDKTHAINRFIYFFLLYFLFIFLLLQT